MLNQINRIDPNPPVSLPMQSVEKALYLDITMPSPWPMTSLSISSPVIAGVHGRRAGIGTVHKVINDNPHDRRGPLKLPARQQAMALLEKLLFLFTASQFMVPSQRALVSRNGTRASLQFSPATPSNLEFWSLTQGYPNTLPAARLEH